MTGEEEAAELRALIREAHEAIKDLHRLTGQARLLSRDCASESRRAAHQAASAELDRFSRHLQHQLNLMSGELNRGVMRAQREIAHQLAVSELGETPDGKLWVKFSGAPFDEDPYGDDPPEGNSGGPP
ncbi:MAG: hypothetical protein J2P30_01550 [Actinobacteria bacterium]|nr:hypothetical protein [Actinomycetota bacterium]